MFECVRLKIAMSSEEKYLKEKGFYNWLKYIKKFSKNGCKKSGKLIYLDKKFKYINFLIYKGGF